ncbi:C2 domain-containing protein [Mycotypha africana]|uniref:C2 domain-containing protein n=1 Tax=Mycotypha africana TaxID=64632 RepID=UPI002301D4BD|nr:C2 domain-containing protein [Mycotypha africana]KAI8982459.1 C2 domain-containing protein [Mycotypha africana]
MFSKNPAGTLNVTVIEGRNLKDQDLVGKNDPWVELWVDEKYPQRTRVIDNTNNPVWNQTFTFQLEASRKDKLHLKVLDKDKIGNDTIGEAKFDLDQVFSGQPVDTWVKLPAKLGLTSHGEIHLYVQFFPQQ